MKRAIFASLLALTLGAASSQAQTYTYDPVNKQFVPTVTTQPNIVQAAAAQVLPQYFGTPGTVQSNSYYPYSTNGYYNNGYYNNGSYNNGRYYNTPGGYNNTGMYAVPYNTGVNGSVYYQGGRGWRR